MSRRNAVARTFLPTLLLLAAAGGGLRAQTRAGFRPQQETRWVESFTPFQLYGLRGTDTLDLDAHAGYTLQEWTWLQDSPQHVQVRSYYLDPPVVVPPDTYTATLTHQGDIVESHGSPVEPALWNRLLPHLPADGRLTRGRTWADTLTDSRGGFNPFAMARIRAFRVTRVTDTLGTRVAVIDATMREIYHFRPHFKGEWGWMEGRGDGHATYLFDLRAGRVIAFRESHTLPGLTAISRPAGAAGRTGGLDTVPAVVHFPSVWRDVTGERADLLQRLADAERSMSSVPGSRRRFSTYRIRISGDTVESLWVDGVERVMVARTIFSGGRVIRHSWTETTATADRAAQLAAPGSAAAGERSLDVPPGAEAWAVADVGMEDHLMPVLAALSRSCANPCLLTIYRPATDAWETRSVSFATITPSIRAAILTDPGKRVVEAALAFDREERILCLFGMIRGAWSERSSLGLRSPPGVREALLKYLPPDAVSQFTQAHRPGS